VVRMQKHTHLNASTHALQHTATHCNSTVDYRRRGCASWLARTRQFVAACCSVFQCVAATVDEMRRSATD